MFLVYNTFFTKCISLSAIFLINLFFSTAAKLFLEIIQKLRYRSMQFTNCKMQF
jgi:hypothetical protein